MFGAKVHVKSDELLDQGIGAVSQVTDGFDGVLEIGTGRMDGNADRAAPPLQQWHYVIHEGIVRVCGIRDTFVAPEPSIRRDVIVEHPIVATLLRLRHHRPVHALHHVQHSVVHRPLDPFLNVRRIVRGLLRFHVRAVVLDDGQRVGVQAGQVPARLLHLSDDRDAVVRHHVREYYEHRTHA